MKILLLVLGAWFFLALFFVFALAAARAKPIPPVEPVKATEPVPQAKRQRRKLRPVVHTQENEPALIRNPA